MLTVVTLAPVRACMSHIARSVTGNAQMTWVGVAQHMALYCGREEDVGEALGVEQLVADGALGLLVDVGGVVPDGVETLDGGGLYACRW
jgi:hypothetical protein